MKILRMVRFFALYLAVLSGCVNEEVAISKEQAENIVIDHHTNSIGVVEIQSITHSRDKYIVQWENERNCEKGKDYVDDQSGKVKVVEASIC